MPSSTSSEYLATVPRGLWTQRDYDAFLDEVRLHFGDKRWRMDHLYRIVNEQGQDVSFRMNDVQTLLYLRMHYCNIVLKSRQHGVTTLSCLFGLDSALTVPNFHAAIIAHNKEDAQDFFDRNIKFAYDSLPEEIKEARRAETDSARMLSFSNGSSIKVTTSGRSGTFQFIHISELGKIAAAYPDKATEIKTGTLNAIHPGQIVIIESTAEGREGLFYDMCKTAENLQKSGRHLTKMDYKFFFFPWYLNPLNVLMEPVEILGYQQKYFDDTLPGVKLTRAQKAWYVKKWAVQGEDMKREHPSTPDEAFAGSVEGAYFTAQFTKIRKEGRICRVPHTSAALVDTWWDLGMDDSTCIWFTQDVGREIHVLRYYENSGEGMDHYRDILLSYKDLYGYRYRMHGAPHDIKVRELFLQGKSRLQAAMKMGINFRVAPKLSHQAGIEQTRQILNLCWFDESGCVQKYGDHLVGLGSLENYRKEWNDKLQTYRNVPLHNWASHGAKAFQTLAFLHQFGLNMEDGVERRPTVQPGGRRNTDRRNPRGWT